jgi:hypothetical protein
MTPTQIMAWRSMLNAELLSKYWDKKAFRMTVWLYAIKITAGLIGCGTIATILVDPNLVIWSKVAAFVSAALTIYVSVVDPKNALDQALAAREAYRALFYYYETLWVQVLLGMSEVEIAAELKRLREEHLKIKIPLTFYSEGIFSKSVGKIMAERALSADKNEFKTRDGVGSGSDNDRSENPRNSMV